MKRKMLSHLLSEQYPWYQLPKKTMYRESNFPLSNYWKKVVNHQASDQDNKIVRFTKFYYHINFQIKYTEKKLLKKKKNLYLNLRVLG